MNDRPFVKGDATLGVWSLSFLTSPALRRITSSAGFALRPGFGDAIGVWGCGRPAVRGRIAAKLSGKPLVSLEDGFLRSVLPGRGQPVVSMIADDLGIYFNAARASRLDHLIQAAGDNSEAVSAMAAIRATRLSKYNHAADMQAPPKGHVLVIDQTLGDASIRFGNASRDSFGRMLDAARSEHPNAEIIIKTHPEATTGAKKGYFSAADADDRTRVLTDSVNPWDLLEGAAAVFTVTSQMGMEALMAGAPVRCFGMPFYAGWGATRDEIAPPDHRGAKRDVASIFRAAYLEYPIYLDPWREQRTDFWAAIEALQSLRASHRLTTDRSVATGMRLWKRGHVRAFLGPKTRFEDDPNKAQALAKRLDGRVVGWGDKAPENAWRMEDGFLRSTGLGAELTPPLSLSLDDEGVYFDPTQPSRLERLIGTAPTDVKSLLRAEALCARIVELGLTKYNLTGQSPPPPDGARVILVPGQVEDDASILKGAGEIRTNATLLSAVRLAAPDAHIIYKPHPDVEAGLRIGAASGAEADRVASNEPAAALLAQADEVWTMTSTMGFEALMRGKMVVCFGAPFYAGWGLTADRGETPARRVARPSLAQLVHACLIDYPLYRDPVSGLPCSPEVVVDRLASGEWRAGPGIRVLSKLQGLFASYAGLWR